MAEKEDLIGVKFLNKSEITEISPLKQYEVVCLYFASNWCAPCQKFLPKLVDFYQQINLEDKILEIIYVSRDKTKEEFEEYYGKMSWLSIPWGDSRLRKLVEKYEIKGIPQLVILKKNGEVASYKGKNDICDVGIDVFTQWQELVKIN